MQLKTKPILLAILIIFGIAIAAFVFTSNFRYTSPTAIKNYLRTHGNDVSIFCLEPQNPKNSFFHQSEELFPLAGTIKIVLLTAYAGETVAGTLMADELINLDEVNRYFLAGTDGGAHSEFLKSLDNKIGKITMDEIVTGMTTYGSNAAFDYLLSRLKKSDFELISKNNQLDRIYNPQSFLGLYLFMNNHETGLYADEELTESEIRNEEDRLASKYVFDSSWRKAENKYQEKYINLAPAYIQKEVVGKIGNQGSAKDMLRLMMAAYDYEPGLTSSEQQIMQKHLEWPMKLNPENTKKYSRLASISGVWPAVFTSIWYGKTSEDKSTFLGVFYRNIPDDFWNTWMTTFTHQQFESQILSTGNCSQFPRNQ